MSEKIQLDIQPPTSIYSTYQRLTYTIWHAIAEFVDNSTASYELHKNELKKIPGYKLKIYIVYQIASRAEDCTLAIFDNAYGMEREDFERAVILNSPPKDKTGRNEFGMGLKTAACWFGNEWTIKSTQLGSENLYSVTMDIERLALTNEKNININVDYISSKRHHTQLIIRKLHRKITTGSRNKVINQISSIYRKDLREDEIEITYMEQSYDSGGNPRYSNDGRTFYSSMEEVPRLKYELPKVWEYIDNETGEKKQYLKKFSDEIIFNGQKYPFNGFVAIREMGSRSGAGLTLIRRNRVIIGGPDSSYRPKEIFGDAGTFTYQRIFGEVNMNNWPVTQAKNAFDWDNGLEEIFISKMNNISKELRLRSESLRKEVKINPKTASFIEIKKSNLSIEQMFKNPIGNLIIDKLKEVEENGEENFSETTNNQLSNYLIFKVNDQTNKEIYINYEADLLANPEEWLKIIFLEKQENRIKFKVTVFYEHPFFKPYVNDGEFMLVLKKFAIALAVSVINAEFSPTIKGFQSYEVLKFMNEYLKQVIDEVN